MKTFDKIFLLILAGTLVLFLTVNVLVLQEKDAEGARPYQVEINRLALQIESTGLESIDISQCRYVKKIEKYQKDHFYDSESDYSIREIKGEPYRFDYDAAQNAGNFDRMEINLSLGAMAACLLSALLFVRQKILLPFWELSEVPYELAKGNLAVPLKENKGRFFGRFVWGLDLLREKLEEQKQRELDLQREKKVLLLSLSHDLKTPLSAIKLYAGALSRGLYCDEEKQIQIAKSIDAKADEIEKYVSEIIRASKEEFLDFKVKQEEFYLSALVESIRAYYAEKLALVKTDFAVEPYTDCLLKGDLDRSVEVVQNVMENALKYGDGKEIALRFSQEDGCVLLSVENSGCTLTVSELPHIFESFWRGSNVRTTQGSGLGLYICRELMGKMKGEIFAGIREGRMAVTMVFSKA